VHVLDAGGQLVDAAGQRQRDGFATHGDGLRAAHRVDTRRNADDQRDDIGIPYRHGQAARH
jgi:hypothetical protein